MKLNRKILRKLILQEMSRQPWDETPDDPYMMHPMLDRIARLGDISFRIYKNKDEIMNGIEHGENFKVPLSQEDYHDLRSHFATTASTTPGLTINEGVDPATVIMGVSVIALFGAIYYALSKNYNVEIKGKGSQGDQELEGEIIFSRPAHPTGEIE